MKIRLAPWMLRLAYNFIDVESLGESSVFESRTLEYGYAISKLCQLPPGRLLDVGCTARINPIPSTFCELGWEVIGMDIREYNYKHANFKFRYANILDYRFPKDSLDAVTCISTLEHIGLKRYGGKEEAQADTIALFNIRDFLKPGGILILTTPYSNNLVGYETKLERIYGDYSIEGWSKMLKLIDIKTLDLGCYKLELLLSTWTKKE